MTEQRTYSTREVASIVRGSLLGWGVMTIVFCATPSLLIYFSIPHFRQLFRGFGADLPGTTMFLLEWRYLLWIFPGLALLLLSVALTTRPERAIAGHRRIAVAFVLLCLTSQLVNGFALSALYAPIFKLGAVV